MLTIKIENKNYDIPTEWKDMKLSFWYGIYNIIEIYLYILQASVKKRWKALI